MEWAARVIGAFYVIAGLIALRQALFNWRLERVVAAIAPSSAAERAADLALTAGSVMVLAAGGALILLHAWAPAGFLAAWAVQAVYLLWAQRWLAPQDPVAARGRRQTINAFAIYTVATLAVFGFGTTGLFD